MTNPSQRPLPDNTQHSQQTNIRAAGGNRTHDLSRRAAEDLRLRPHGHWDRQSLDNKTLKTDVLSYRICCSLTLTRRPNSSGYDAVSQVTLQSQDVMLHKTWSFMRYSVIKYFNTDTCRSALFNSMLRVYCDVMWIGKATHSLRSTTGLHL